MTARLWIAALATALSLSLSLSVPAPAQDTKPDPADVEQVKALLEKATTALREKDGPGFVECCDIYVDCFFADGTLVKGKKTIESTLGQYFARRPENMAVLLIPVPRSFRVLSKDIITVDWPAVVVGSGSPVQVNTFTTFRRTDGRWFLTSYLESVPYTGPLGGRNLGR